MRTVVVSGGFDPIHPGHLALFRQARALGDRLVVVVESDAWVAKKHRVQQTQRDRAALVAEIAGVDAVMLNPRADGDCSELVLACQAAVFAVGRDHQDVGVIPEYAALTAAGVRIQPILTDYDSYRSSKIVAAAEAGGRKNPIPMVAALIIRVNYEGPTELLVATRRDNGLMELPGGFVEVGETYEQAVEREVKEELGVKFAVTNGDYCGNHVGKYRDGRDVVVTAFTGAVPDDPYLEKFAPTEEVAAVHWASSVIRGGWDNEVDRRIATIALARSKS